MSALHPDQLARASRLKVRLGAWPAVVRPRDGAAFYKAVAPLCLPLMFDAAKVVIDFEDTTAVYEFRTWEPVFNTVGLYTDNWRWVVGDGSAEGRGLVALWSWRWDRCCTLSHMDLLGLLDEAEQAAKEAAKPKRRKKAA